LSSTDNDVEPHILVNGKYKHRKLTNDFNLCKETKMSELIKFLLQSAQKKKSPAGRGKASTKNLNQTF